MGLAMLFARILPSTTEPGSGGSFVFCKHHPCPVLLLYRAKTGNYTKAAISKVTHDNFLWSRRPTTTRRVLDDWNGETNKSTCCTLHFKSLRREIIMQFDQFRILIRTQEMFSVPFPVACHLINKLVNDLP